MRGRIGLGLLLLVLACHDDDKTVAPTGPGVLDVILSTPNNDDGAVLLTVDGAVDSVQGAPYVIFSTVSATGARVVVTGDVVAGVIARLYVPEVGAADQYLTNLNEVAQRGTYLLRPTTSYQLELKIER
ncbi:MAG TPA: hypothetical protein VFU03_10870 [Gemmatimonadales bacterium]|nr:hypothetical protein [Gemmatimonadales bacterium]